VTAPARLWFAVATLAFLLRLPFILLAPAITPDGETALLVAENIRLNGCVSVSEPAGGECRPHAGGNQPPFYPAAIALAHAVFGPGETSVRLIQAAAYSAAVGWLAYAAASFAGLTAAGVAVGLAMALSPVQLAWPRFLLTESFALAGTLWVFAECLLSLKHGRLRALPLTAALLAAIAARYDSVLLAAPVAVVGFLLHPPLEAIRKGAAMALLLALPVGLWTWRNLEAGLPLRPQTFMKTGEPNPAGFLAWCDVWVTTLYEGTFSYRTAYREYDRMQVGPGAWRSEAERAKVQALLAELARHAGQPFPEHIDRAFAELAQARKRDHPFEAYLLVPLKRMAFYWLNPIHSFAWPVELHGVITAQERSRFQQGGLGDKMEVALRHADAVAVKLLVAGYRVLLIAAAAAAAVLALRGRLGAAATPLWLGLGYALFRTAAFAQQSSMDNRYMIEGFAWAEAGIALTLTVYWSRQRRLAPAPAAP
jgi:hypothetical protein